MNDDFDNDFQDFIDDLEMSEKNEKACNLDNPEDCEACGS